MPPLRERKEDIPLLISYFLSNLNAKYKAYTTITPEAVKILENYHWPGNIRELEHVLERLVLIADDEVIGPDSLPAAIKEKKIQSAPVTPTKSNASYKEMEIEQILNLYQKLRSSYKVAEELHISQSKARRIINKYLKNKTDFS